MNKKETQQILRIAKTRNPIYFKYIKPFVKGGLEQLPHAENDDDLVPEISGHTLNMNKKSCCIAGELNQWKFPYVHENMVLSEYYDHNDPNCIECDKLGIALWNTSIEIDNNDENDPDCSPSVECFLMNLKELYIHLGYMK
jgi:hypothetical protein